MGGTLLHTWEEKHFYSGVSDNNDVSGYNEEDVSEANILASKLSAGARI